MACFGCFGVSSSSAPSRPMLPPLGMPLPTRRIVMGDSTNTSHRTYPPLTQVRRIGHPIHNNQIRVTDPDKLFTDEQKEALYQRMQAVHTFFYEKFGIEAVSPQTIFPPVKVYVEDPDNANWSQSIRDGWYFGNRSISIETVAHEYIHAVVQRITQLGDSAEQKALNESLADVFASIFKQHENRQNVNQADWLMTDEGESYRSLTTFPAAGKYPTLVGEEHADAAIGNYPFYIAATKIGGNSWETIAKIWCAAMKNTKANDGFFMFFAHTCNATTTLYPQHITVIREAWSQVGVEFRFGSQ